MRRAVVLGLLALPTLASAHLQLRAPLQRVTAQKEGPCGAAGSKRGTNVTVYQPGETITLEWDETVDHPGHFRVAFDDDGDDDFINPLRSTDNFSSTLMDNIVDKQGGHYTQQITLPTTPCTNCTLQVMQIMQVSEPYSSFYWQCADIMIAGDAPAPEPDDTSGGCSTGRGAGLGLALALLAVVPSRRR